MSRGSFAGKIVGAFALVSLLLGPISADAQPIRIGNPTEDSRCNGIPAAQRAGLTTVRAINVGSQFNVSVSSVNLDPGQVRDFTISQRTALLASFSSNRFRMRFVIPEALTGCLLIDSSNNRISLGVPGSGAVAPAPERPPEWLGHWSDPIGDARCAGIPEASGARQTTMRVINTSSEHQADVFWKIEVPGRYDEPTRDRQTLQPGQIVDFNVDHGYGSSGAWIWTRTSSTISHAVRKLIPTEPTACVLVSSAPTDMQLGMPGTGTAPATLPPQATGPLQAGPVSPPQPTVSPGQTGPQTTTAPALPRPDDPYATLGPMEPVGAPPSAQAPRPVSVTNLGRPRQCPGPRLTNPAGNLPPTNGTLPLAPGQSIARGETFRSANGLHLVRFSQDGRLQFQWAHNDNPSFTHGLGASATRVEMRSDGRLHVVYDNGGSQPILPRDTDPTEDGASLSLLPNGRPAFVAADGRQVFPALTTTPISTQARPEIMQACTVSETIDGWPRCLRLKDSGVLIYGSPLTTRAAMTSVAVVYHELLSRLYTGYPVRNFEGFKVYLTNGETIDQLIALPGMGGRIHGSNEADNRLRGAGGERFLWISEQMICKHGVATRNEDAAACRGDGLPDHEYRQFDQVVHEIAHSIDSNFGKPIMSSRPPWGGHVERFAWEVQARFGALQGGLGESEGRPYEGAMRGIFPTAVTFACDGYAPAPTTAAGSAPPPAPPPQVQPPPAVPASAPAPAPAPEAAFAACVGQLTGGGVLDWGGGSTWAEGNARTLCQGVATDADTDTRFDCFRRERDARGSWEAALPVCAAAEAGTPPTATAGGPAQPQEQFLPEAEEILRLVNEFRSQPRRCGRTSFQAAPPLSLDPLLVQAAFDHSQDMALNNYYAHRSRDGRGPGDRIEATGYSHRGWRENIFAGPKTVERAFQGWVESPGHCANMMSSEMEEMGIAYVRSDSGRWNDYWTMKLARPAD